jgi:hypothetical protein
MHFCQSGLQAGPKLSPMGGLENNEPVCLYQ